MRLSNVHAPVVNGWMQKEPLVSRNTNRKGKADQILCRLSFTLSPSLLFMLCSVNFFSIFFFSPSLVLFPSYEEKEDDDAEQQEPIPNHVHVAILLLQCVAFHCIALHDVLHVSVHCHCAFRPSANKGSLSLLSKTRSGGWRCSRAPLLVAPINKNNRPLTPTFSSRPCLDAKTFGCKTL